MLKKLLLLLLIATNAHATLKIDITQGNVEPMPIGLNSFYTPEGAEDDVGKQIREVIVNDLVKSGLFRSIEQRAFLEQVQVNAVPTFVSWRQIGAMAVSTGMITRNGGDYRVEFRLWDPSLEQQIEGQVFNFPEYGWRRASHQIADKIYKRLTGEEGYFDTRILFVSEAGEMTKRIKKLTIMDQDGANLKELTDGKHLVLTPRFDSKLQRAIYMSYKNRTPQVFILDIGTGTQSLLGNFPGMSFAPRFSPDGQGAIFSIAKDGTTDIYEIDLNTRRLTKLTSGAGTINTSPSYSPDGKRITFTSDRGGKPQLYTMTKDGNEQKRISFGDGSYSTPVWSPRGDFIAFTKQKGGQFYIGVLRPDGTGERLLTSSWMDEGPTWSPNGRVLMFSRQKKGEGYRIFAVDLTGYNERIIQTPTDASDPAWSPLLG
ncbi:MAG: Tol-Pal system beta propeller repeat protein TolB [Rickettsiales bacterium]